MNQPTATKVSPPKSNPFLSSGHLPTLIACLLYFDVSFMVWVLLGPLAPFLSEDLKLTAAQKGLMVAVPLLGGALFRPLMGVLGDLLGGRRAGMLGLGLTLLPLLLGGASRGICRICTSSEFCWASRGPASPWPCRLPAAGTRPSVRD